MPENTGYYDKFTVIRNSTGETVDEPTFTVLLESDPFALTAMEAYADVAELTGGYEDLVAGFREYIAERREGK